MKTYKEVIDPRSNTLCAINVVGENLSIPIDPANTDYQQYLKWLEEGNTPEPADEVNNV